MKLNEILTESVEPQQQNVSGEEYHAFFKQHDQRSSGLFHFTEVKRSEEGDDRLFDVIIEVSNAWKTDGNGPSMSADSYEDAHGDSEFEYDVLAIGSETADNEEQLFIMTGEGIDFDFENEDAMFDEVIAYQQNNM